MPTLTITEIIQLKDLLKPFGITLHTHDACGGQSFGLEAEGIPQAAYIVLEDFMSSRQLDVLYYDGSKKGFTIKNKV